MHQHYLKYYKNCPNCKSNLEVFDTNIKCTQCEFKIYNNPVPAVSAGIIKNSKILLAKRSIKPKKGWWDTIGGFIETNESAEQAVIRETKEETNLDITKLILLGSNYDQCDGIPIINFSFYVEVDKTQFNKLKAMDDVAELKWFELNNPPKKIAFKSIESTIKLFHDYINKKNNTK